MLDTIIISTTNFKVLNFGKFEIRKGKTTSYKNTYIQNSNGISLTLTIFKGEKPSILTISFSIPSLLFGNNFIRPQKDDLDTVDNNIKTDYKNNSFKPLEYAISDFSASQQEDILKLIKNIKKLTVKK